jgi:hypothetical protein
MLMPGIGQSSAVHKFRHQAQNPMDKTNKIPTKVLMTSSSPRHSPQTVECRQIQ